MSYVITRYNGTALTTVDDGTINQVTELKLIGKNYAGYGLPQNDNFVYLLENFAGATAPLKPISGMLWYDSSANKIKVYDGSKFKATGSAEVSSTAPTGLTEGDIWWNSLTNQLYVRNSLNDWVLIGPQGAGTGITQMQSVTLTDTSGISHAVIAATIENAIEFIISPDTFTLASSNAITGFDVIKKGITLINTQASTNGVTSDDHYFWGTASNAAMLGGIPASSYVTTSSSTNFANAVAFGDNGFTIGNDSDIRYFTDSADNVTPVVQLVRNAVRYKDSASNLIFTITNTGIIPGTTSTYNLGSLSNQWNTIYATNFNGIASQASTMTVSGTGLPASVAATPNTIAARDSSGNLNAVLFSGTATQARYADLAEKYTTDAIYPVGTAMTISYNDISEATCASAKDFCIGVISAEPAYLMNSESAGQAIGLKGRVPVRVVGPVSKGQAVYSYEKGVSSTVQTNGLVGIALETNNEAGEKLVECVLKV